MRKELKKLSDGEFEVLQALWAAGGKGSRRDIEEQLPQKGSMAMTTLLTFLSRLAEKEYISVEKTGNSNIFTALVSEDEYLSEQSREFIRRSCKGNISVFASALCSSGISRDELDELKKLLEEYRK